MSLARTNKILSKYLNNYKNEGYLFWREGNLDGLFPKVLLTVYKYG